MSRPKSPNAKTTPECRCEMCGKKFYEAINGELRECVYECKQWKICPRCFKIHLKFWLLRVQYLFYLNCGRCYLTTFTWDNYHACELLIRRLRSHKASAVIFRSEDKIYVFHNDSDEDGLKTIEEDIDSYDWDVITRTKDNRHISTLGKVKFSKDKIDTSEMEAIHAPLVQTDADKDENEAFWQEARLECGDPQPVTTQEETEMTGQVLQKFEEILNRNGFNVVSILYSKRYVKKDRNKTTWKPLNSLKIQLPAPQFAPSVGQFG